MGKPAKMQCMIGIISQSIAGAVGIFFPTLHPCLLAVIPWAIGFSMEAETKS